MPYSKVLFVSYNVPTFFPSDAHAGGVAPQNGAPLVNLADADLCARAQRFLNVLFWAQAQLAAATPDATDSSVLKVFMAPEFYFRKASATDLLANAFDRTRSFWGSYPRGSRQELMDALYQAIGNHASFKDWTVVAGTVCSWAPEDADRIPFLNNTALLLRGPRANLTGAPYTFLEKHYFSPIDLNLHDPTNDQWNVTRSMTSVFSMQRNPDFVLDNLVEWDDLLQGTEICLDHAYDMVRTGLQLLSQVWDQGVTYCDLQLVTSCGMTIRRTAVGVRPGGLVMLTDGQSNLPQMARYTPQVNPNAAELDYLAFNNVYPLPNDADHRVGNVAGAQQIVTFAATDLNIAGGA